MVPRAVLVTAVPVPPVPLASGLECPTRRPDSGGKTQPLGIENGLHWVLDMQFWEDESRAGSDNSAENLNVLRHWAYNILKAEDSVKGSFPISSSNTYWMSPSWIKL